MSFTLQLSGSESVLKAQFFPPLTLKGGYELGLVGLESWNSIPNVTVENNIFYYSSSTLEIPVGSYEINDIAEFIEEKLQDKHGAPETHSKLGTKYLSLKGNTQTLKSEILCRYSVDFTRKTRNIGSLLGFRDVVVNALEKKESSDLVDILQVETWRIECDVVTGSFTNGKPTHTLYEFCPDVPPGYKVLEIPRTVIYLPIAVKVIDSVEIRICDQNENLVDLRGEKTSIRVHLRPQDAHHL